MAAFTIPIAQPQLGLRAPSRALTFQKRDMYPQHMLLRPTTSLRAINMYTVPEDQYAPKDQQDTSKRVSETERSHLADYPLLQQQVEDLWHEYAAVRKRYMKSQVEKVELQTQFHNSIVALKQERHNCRRLEELVGNLTARLEWVEGRI